MRVSDQLPGREARWLAIDGQGLGRVRPAHPTRAHMHSAIKAVGTVQLDAINVLARTQFLLLFSRLGAYDTDHFHDLTGPGRELFEYWGHAASLLPIGTHPLWRWRIAAPFDEAPMSMARYAAWAHEHRRYIAQVLAEVRDTGAMPASQLSEPRRQDGEWWGRRSVGRQALEWLFARGELAGWRTPNFERVYDLPERVIPATVLDAPTPPVEQAQRELLLLAAAHRGLRAGTETHVRLLRLTGAAGRRAGRPTRPQGRSQGLVVARTGRARRGRCRGHPGRSRGRGGARGAAGVVGSRHREGRRGGESGAGAATLVAATRQRREWEESR